MEPSDRKSGHGRNLSQQSQATDPFAAAGEAPTLRPAAETNIATPPPTNTRLSAEREMCPSGLARYQGQTDDPPAIVQHIGQFAAWHLILTRSALPEPLTIELKTSKFLWNWYPLEVQERVSPVLLSPADGIDLAQVVRESWGRDSIVWIFVDGEKADLLKQLTAAVRGDDGSSKDPPERVLGFNLPSAARPMLNQLGLAVAAPLKSTVLGLLMEAEDPGAWQLYCSEKLDRALSATIK